MTAARASLKPCEVGALADGLGRRWPETLAWGFGMFLAAGVPAIYCWLILGASLIDLAAQSIGGRPSAQDWTALSAHLPLAIGVGVLAWAIAAAACALVARWRRLALTPMLAIGWIAFIAPFSLWMALIRPGVGL